MFLFQILTLLITMSCDRVEKSATKLLETSYYLQSKAEDRFVQEELIQLSRFLKQLSPKFEASGFFRINQRLIPAFLSVLSTYIIIIIQFKM
ncbi:hypothetical protein JTB14_000020 [Gonioctena quinquepunctata]|nr:hypothetical protein JTB14_000020 [Gonioctena quinquepunctata]